jgi:hypothetical protein
MIRYLTCHCNILTHRCKHVLTVVCHAEAPGGCDEQDDFDRLLLIPGSNIGTNWKDMSDFERDLWTSLTASSNGYRDCREGGGGGVDIYSQDAPVFENGGSWFDDVTFGMGNCDLSLYETVPLSSSPSGSMFSAAGNVHDNKDHDYEMEMIGCEESRFIASGTDVFARYSEI